MEQFHMCVAAKPPRITYHVQQQGKKKKKKKKKACERDKRHGG